MVAIFVVLTIVGFLLADWIVQLIAARRNKIMERGKYPVPPEFQTLSSTDPLKPPQGLFFHKGHCWAQIEPSGTVKVGLDGLISNLIGRIDEVRLPQTGQEVREGDPIASIRQGDHVLTFVSPLDGQICKVNPSLCENGECVKAEPYGAGWVCVIRPKSLAAQTRRLVVGEDVVAWHTHEMKRLASFFGKLAQDQTSDLPKGALEQSPDEDWQRFQREFLYVNRNLRSEHAR